MDDHDRHWHEDDADRFAAEARRIIRDTVIAACLIIIGAGVTVAAIVWAIT